MAMLNRHTATVSMFHELFDFVYDTHQSDFMELTEPGTRSHGDAERALES